MKRTLLILVLAFGLIWGSTACTAESIARDAIRYYFPVRYEKALAVATCESGLRADAISPGGANWGLFQINRVHEGRVRSLGYTWSQMLDPYVNTRVALSIYKESGWAPWACG